MFLFVNILRPVEQEIKSATMTISAKPGKKGPKQINMTAGNEQADEFIFIKQ